MSKTRTVVALTLIGIVLIGCVVSKKRNVVKHPPPPPPPLPTGLAFRQSRTVSVEPTHRSLSYIPTDFALTSIRTQHGKVVLTWINGTPPFQPQLRTNVLSEWQDYGPATSLRQITNAAPTSKLAMFRVKSSTPSGQLILSRKAVAPLAAFGTGVACAPNGAFIVIGTAAASIDVGTGPIPVPGGGGDNYVAKFSAAGAVEWVRVFGNSFDDAINGVATDTSGNIFVTGSFHGTVIFGSLSLTGISDAYVVKYSPSGAVVWLKQLGGSGSESGNAIAVDGSGNLFLAGTYTTTNANFDGLPLAGVPPGSIGGFTAKLSGVSGAVSWVKSYVAPAMTVNAVTADKAGDAIVVGGFFGSCDFGNGLRASAGESDIFIVKHSGADGKNVWSKTMGGASGDIPKGVCAMTNNVIVTGVYRAGTDFGGPITDPFGSVNNLGGIFLANYTAAGAYVWARTPNLSVFGLGGDSGFAVAADETGIYYTGEARSGVYFSPDVFPGGGSGLQYFVASFTASATYRWAHVSGGASPHGGRGVARDSFGHVVTAGTFAGPKIVFDQPLGDAGGFETTTGNRAGFAVQYAK